MFKPIELFSLEHSIAGKYLEGFENVWEALPGIKEEIIRLGEGLDKNEYEEISPQVWVHKTAKIAPTAYLGAPCIIGPETEVRHCAFIRGSALAGANCVIGNSVEIKNAILFDNVQTPHYNYVGDSILGYKSHMGAGSITSNVKQDKTNIVIKTIFGKNETGLRKFGAILGDNVEIGCNCVLNPGTIIGNNTNVYPLVSVRGYIQSDLIVKSADKAVKKKRSI